jgi:hypothetical protein
MVEADEKKKAAIKEQSNTSTVPETEVRTVVDENATETEDGEPGSPLKDDSEVSNGQVGDKESETPKDQKIKKSELTDKEKAEYSFKKQLAAKDRKHAEELANIRKEIAEMKEGKNASEPKVTKDNFETEEDYIAYKAREEALKLYNEMQKQSENVANESRQVEQRTAAVANKVETLFSNPEEKKQYVDMVQHAVDVGLGDFLNNENKERTIMSFIDNSPIGPRILQHLIGFPDKLREIYETTDIMDKKVELKLLEREIKAMMINKPVETKSAPSPKPVVIGKLGAPAITAKLSSKEDDAESMRLIRGY